MNATFAVASVMRGAVRLEIAIITSSIAATWPTSDRATVPPDTVADLRSGEPLPFGRLFADQPSLGRVRLKAGSVCPAYG